MLFFAGYFFFADEVVSSMGLTAEVEYIAKNYIFAMVVAMVFISLIIPDSPLGIPTLIYSFQSQKRLLPEANISFPINLSSL